MKLVYQYMAIFFNFSHTSTHLCPLQGQNCDSNSRLLVDDDDNGKFRLERFNIHCSMFNVDNSIISNSLQVSMWTIFLEKNTKTINDFSENTPPPTKSFFFKLERQLLLSFFMQKLIIVYPIKKIPPNFFLSWLNDFFNSITNKMLRYCINLLSKMVAFSIF